MYGAHEHALHGRDARVVRAHQSKQNLGDGEVLDLAHEQPEVLGVGLEKTRRLGRATRDDAPDDFAEVPGEHLGQRVVGVDEPHDPTEQLALVLAQRREDRVQLAAEDLARQVRVLELAPRVGIRGRRVHHERHQLLHHRLGFQTGDMARSTG